MITPYELQLLKVIIYLMRFAQNVISLEKCSACELIFDFKITQEPQPLGL